LKQASIAGAVFVTIGLSIAWYLNWIPFPDFLLSPPLVIGSAALLIFGVLIWKLYQAEERFRNLQNNLLQRKPKTQLTEKEAFELIRFDLWENENIRIGESVKKGTKNVNPQDKQGDPVRVYRLISERVMVNEEVGVVMDLEQEMDVDVDSWESLEEAA
jgi:hypothetical protein